MRYLVQKHQLPDHWYPSDLEKRAKINEYLDWHHQNLRVGAGHTIYNQARILSSKFLAFLAMLMSAAVSYAPLASTESGEAGSLRIEHFLLCM